MKRAAGLLALCSLAATPVIADEYKLGESYTVAMTGCITKELADIVVDSAKKSGSGASVYRIGVQGGVCGRTVGLTKFVEVYEAYTDGGTPIWYVKYEVLKGDGSWAPFWGFTWWAPAREEETPKMGGYQCGSIRNCS